jgi:F-type H+-transporting ATPase subunit epsilon
MEPINHTFKLNIISVEKEYFRGDVEFVRFTSKVGELGVMAHHIPLLTTLVPGPIVYKINDTEEVFFSSGGLVEFKNNTLNILADTCIRAADLDEMMLKSAQEKAQQALLNKEKSKSFNQAYAELARTTALLKTIQELRKIRDTKH